MKPSVILLTGLLAMASATAAFAHAFPERMSPGAGQVLRAAPPQISIWFDAEIEPLLSTLVVKDARGQVVSAGPASVDAENPMRLNAALKPLGPGEYHVYWRAVAHDGHLTEGQYAFSVVPAH